jgi:hypothetical protein
LEITDDLSDRLIRLPLWSGMQDERERVIGCVRELVRQLGHRTTQNSATAV